LRKKVARAAAGACACLAVIVLVACCFGTPRVMSSPPAQPVDLLNEPAELDSFSAPGLACAVLQKEEQRLMQVYFQTRDAYVAPRCLITANPLRATPQSGAGQACRSPGFASHPTALQLPEVQSLFELDARVQTLQANLNASLLTVYWDQEMWGAYVDRYLQLICENPHRPQASLNARSALECAEKCGRVEELEDVLRHIIRFHPEWPVARSLKDLLAERHADRPQD
jgi:hypothetical protein